MPRPDPRAPGPGQDSLLGDDDPAPAVLHPLDRGPIEKAYTDALEHARTDGVTDRYDGGLAAALLGSARALDRADGDYQAAYKFAKLLPAVLDASTALHLTPAARLALAADQSDKFAKALHDLAATDDPATADDTDAPVSHPA